MAEALHGWLRRVIQSARPFHSDKDIESGSFWDEAIRTNLKNVRFAIVCCTPENVTASWLNYEAGALAERLEGRTAPLLLGAKPEALKVTPLSRLHAQEADQAGVLHVLRSLNANLVQPLDDALLADEFADKWPKLEEKLKAIPAPAIKVDERSERDMLEEVVGLCRQIGQDVAKPTLQDFAHRVRALDRALANVSPEHIAPKSLLSPELIRGLEESWQFDDPVVGIAKKYAMEALSRELTNREIKRVVSSVRKVSIGLQRGSALEKLVTDTVDALFKAEEPPQG